ncbi:Prolycopene isomerase [Candidatus Electrothrix laxa]
MFSRRDFLRISAMATAAALVNWQCPIASASNARREENEYDAIIIGAGLGGLSCAALLAMSGYVPLVIEKNSKSGGYATSFLRDDFSCEVSLHGVTGLPLSQLVLDQLGVADKLSFVPHDFSWSSRYPGLSLDLPQPPRDEFGQVDPRLALSDAYATLRDSFSDMLTADELAVDESLELTDQGQPGLLGYMNCWAGLLTDLENFYTPDGGMPEDPSQFPVLYPTWYSILNKTLDEIFQDYVLTTPALKAILGQSWHYYGLPPSQIPGWLYLMYTGMYHGYGKYYIEGTSSSLSNALVETIQNAGGEVLLNTEVNKIILENGQAVGVKAKESNGSNPRTRHYYSPAIVSNVAVPLTFGQLLPQANSIADLDDYLDNVVSGQPSTSHCNVWLGLDISKDYNGTFMQHYNNIGSSTLFYGGYDHDEAYDGLLECDPERAGIAVMAYDKILSEYSPDGYLTLTLSLLCGYGPWESFEEEYFAGDKDRYYQEKDSVIEQIIGYIEERALPGLSDLIVMQEASTPLTNVRFTNNTHGAIYGYDQTMDNSGLTRLEKFGQRTPVPGLYLVGAWSYPGGGFEPVMLSGVEAVKCMVEDNLLPTS